MKTLNNIFMETLESFSSVSKPTANEMVLGNRTYIQIPLCIEHANDVYYFKIFNILKSKYNYGDLVDTFITMIYSNQEMTAVINNYLLDPTDEVALNEFNEMQLVRKEAKSVAKEILDNYSI